jgi:hypothetical protein
MVFLVSDRAARQYPPRGNIARAERLIFRGKFPMNAALKCCAEKQTPLTLP